jgi:hypothetical protein
MLQERAQYVGTGKADVDNWGIDSDEEEEAKPSKSKASRLIRYACCLIRYACYLIRYACYLICYGG